jgi:hypothetical protein
MKGKIIIGRSTTKNALVSFRKASREIELENATGWTCRHMPHKSAKDYTRKQKHKNLEI